MQWGNLSFLCRPDLSPKTGKRELKKWKNFSDLSTFAPIPIFENENVFNEWSLTPEQEQEEGILLTGPCHRWAGRWGAGQQNASTGFPETESFNNYG